MAGLDGEETNVNWRHLDDGAKAGHSDVEVTEEIIRRCSDVVRLQPKDIHNVCNDGETASLSMHIHDRDLAHVSRSEFDPINKGPKASPQRVRKRSRPCGNSQTIARRRMRF